MQMRIVKSHMDVFAVAERCLGSKASNPRVPPLSYPRWQQSDKKKKERDEGKSRVESINR